MHKLCAHVTTASWLYRLDAKGVRDIYAWRPDITYIIYNDH